MRSRSALPWLVALLLAPAWAAQADVPTVAGDLVLGGNEALLVEDEDLVVEGSITLAGSASLTLRRGTLDLRPPGGGVATITLRDQARLHLEDATVRGPNAVRILPAGEAAVELRSVAWRDAGAGAIRPADRSRLLIERSELGDTGVTLTGNATGTMANTTVHGGPGVNTWNSAYLRIDGGSINAMQFRGLGAYGASTLHMTNTTADNLGPNAEDQATLIVESSALGNDSPGRTSFRGFFGSPRVAFRDVSLHSLVYYANSRGTIVFDRTPVHFLSGSVAMMRIANGSANLGLSDADVLVVDEGASAVFTGSGTLRNLYLAEGAEMAFVPAINFDELPLGPLIKRFTNACLQGIPAAPGALPYVPTAPLIEQATQVLRVRVEAANGGNVPGARIALASHTGDPVHVYDLSTQATTAERIADTTGAATYHFVPPGPLQVTATAPDGRTGSALAVVATCTEVLVVVE